MATNYLYKLRFHFSWNGEEWECRVCSNTERDGFKVGNRVQGSDRSLQELYAMMVTTENVRRLRQALRDYNYMEGQKELAAREHKRNWSL